MEMEYLYIWAMVVVIQISMAKLFNLLNEDWLLPWSRMLN
jgi:hypothetical protein